MRKITIEVSDKTFKKLYWFDDKLTVEKAAEFVIRDALNMHTLVKRAMREKQ